MGRRLVVAMLLAAGITGAAAQDYPTRPVTLVAPFPPGGPSDTTARLIATNMAKALGQPVIVENVSGAGGTIGSNRVAKATPDGYQIVLSGSGTHAAIEYLVKDPPYKSGDWEHIGLINVSPVVLVAKKDVPANTLAELAAIDRRNPGEYSFAIDGPRNLAGVTAQAFQHHAGTKFVYVTYPNIVNGLQDLVARRLQVGVFPVAISGDFVREGSLKALAVAGLKRIGAFPDVPSAAETYPEFDFSGWFVLLAPKGTPPEIIAKLNEATDKAMRDPQILAMAPKLGYDFDANGSGSPARARQFIAQQLAFWEKTVKQLGIEPE